MTDNPIDTSLEAVAKTIADLQRLDAALGGTGDPVADLLDAMAAKLAQAEKERDGLRAALQITTPTARFEGRVAVAWALLARIARHDWLDDPTEIRRALDGFVEEARDLTINPDDDPTAEYADSLTAAESKAIENFFKHEGERLGPPGKGIIRDEWKPGAEFHLDRPSHPEDKPNE